VDQNFFLVPIVFSSSVSFPPGQTKVQSMQPLHSGLMIRSFLSTGRW
jgi:hypothetical protein